MATTKSKAEVSFICCKKCEEQLGARVANDEFYHIDCFRCCKCNADLTPDTIQIKGDHIFCTMCVMSSSTGASSPRQGMSSTTSSSRQAPSSSGASSPTAASGPTKTSSPMTPSGSAGTSSPTGTNSPTAASDPTGTSPTITSEPPGTSSPTATGEPTGASSPMTAVGPTETSKTGASEPMEGNCYACNKPVSCATSKRLLDRLYHETCAKCAKCDGSFSGERYWAKGGKDYCLCCYQVVSQQEQKPSSARTPETPGGSQRGESQKPGESQQPGGSKRGESQKPGESKKPGESQQPGESQDGDRQQPGKSQQPGECKPGESKRGENALVCYVCRQPFTTTTNVQVLGRLCHPPCVKCEKCGVEFTEKRCYPIDNGIYCLECFWMIVAEKRKKEKAGRISPSSTSSSQKTMSQTASVGPEPQRRG